MGIPEKVFLYEENQVRTITQKGEIWFVAKDVCEVLELGDVSKAVSRLDDDEKGTNSIPTLGGNQEMLMVNEFGLYSLILGSRKPEAKAFKRWITHEVIPSIRKTGKYEAPKETVTEIMLYLKSDLEFKTLKASAQVAMIRAISKDSVSSMKQKSINLPIDTPTGASDLLMELLSHAVPVTTFQPRSMTELKSSVLYDEKFFYIFPLAIEHWVKHYNAKKLIREEIKFLDGIQKVKRFKFLGDKKASEPYHVLILPRRAVRGNDAGNVIAFPSALVGGDTEK